MSIFTTIIPPIAGVVTTTYCPMSNQPLSENRETNAQSIARKLVWPALLTFIGFAWYFARTDSSKKIVPVDVMYSLLTASVCAWMYTQMCIDKPKVAFILLIATIGVTFGVIYNSSRFSTNSLILLTPVVLWLFFTAESSLRELHFEQYFQRFWKTDENIENKNKETFAIY